MKTNTHTNKEQQHEIIPAGYKNTKLGVIPKDWEVKRLGDVFNILQGFAFSSFDSQASGIRWLKIAE